MDDHSVHSPYFFDFYQKVIKEKEKPAFEAIEQTRKKLLTDTHSVTYQDLGTPSKHFKSDQRTIASIASTSLSPQKWSAFYFRVAEHLNAKRIIELGTSMGITTLYLAQSKERKVFTFEGNPSMVNIALTNFEYFDQGNITLLEGNIETSLPDFLEDPSKVDMVLLDANHRYDPTLRYFNWLCKRIADKGIIIVDDIHASPEMDNAWNYLRQHDLVYGSIDLYKCGLLFFDPSLNKQHFIWTL